ncbi:MAG: PQQ-dependent sugar dehydrogenase [Paracoccaceae bacterium]
MRVFLSLLCLYLTATSVSALEVNQGSVSVTPVVTGLEQPWGVAPLPNGAALVTERDGHLLYVQDGQTKRVGGVPAVVAEGQGGLLDVTLARDFQSSRTVFLTFAKKQPNGSGTAIASAQLNNNGSRLNDVKILFEAAPVGRTGRHYGSRVVEAKDGTLFVTIGDRGDRPSAQDRSNHNGSIIRINRDGTVPGDNPFVGQSDIQPHIWSFGHRNPQGAGIDANGTLWTAEHGARGGDEVNRIKKGANFGWPVISYGRHYSGGKIGDGTSKAGMEQPSHFWDPSIAPSGLLVYTGNMFPDWRGDIFVGSLKFDHISRLERKGTKVSEVEQIKGAETDRVRDIVQAPDGSIWFISVGNGTVYRVAN